MPTTDHLTTHMVDPRSSLLFLLIFVFTCKLVDFCIWEFILGIITISPSILKCTTYDEYSQTKWIAHCQFTMPTMLAALSPHGNWLGFIEAITWLDFPYSKCWLVTAVWQLWNLCVYSRCWCKQKGGGCIIKCSSVPVHMYTPHSHMEQLTRLVVCIVSFPCQIQVWEWE